MLSKLKYNITEKSKEEQDVDIIVSKKLFEHIKEFFIKDEPADENITMESLSSTPSTPSTSSSSNSHKHKIQDTNSKNKSFKKYHNNLKNPSTNSSFANHNKTHKKKLL